jgi:hypothetical protein
MVVKRVNEPDYNKEKDQLEKKQEKLDLDKNKTINQVF